MLQHAGLLRLILLCAWSGALLAVALVLLAVVAALPWLLGPDGGAARGVPIIIEQLRTRLDFVL